ncbi:uncharacterized protein K452DRAFT_261378 [Aplosporella prunicola CBS 121167]|uniref:Mitochondrial carrier n=1 Tax=Aplosporella prunicola CBS 121167 TaxID=1176127 RepID=A0A6A6BV56_9PEZI|nr:uncharacterized protein K452DRAFT_261378 [Aplosporella prunicola CBS 121167]KAF2147145.1 hypothetical protein K452DRAFT_261378 [Aplosporella prunicola CBS 121167]
MSADFWAGYLSGAAGILIGNPLDLVKTRLQAGPTAASSPAAAAPGQGWRNAGTYVRGIPAPVLGYGALNAILFVTYNRTLKLLHEPDPSSPSTPLGKVFVAGAVGGFASFVVSAPTELVKCRAQVYAHAPSSWTVARDTWRAEGLPGFYHGGVVTGIRDAVGYAFYFWSYELTKRAITSPDDTEHQAALKVLLCGGLAGIATWASVFPLDVIKTRVQTQEYQAGAVSAAVGEQQALLRASVGGGAISLDGTHRQMGAWDITRRAYRTEGLSVFFRGLGICSVRAFIVNAVQWAVYEWMMGLMQRS